MIVLTEATDNLQVVLNAAHTTSPMRMMSCWRDITTTLYTPGRTVADTNGTTDVNLVPNPSSAQRVVDFLSIYNSDTATKQVTVKFDANGTEYILWRGNVGVGERLEYVDGKGFQLFDLNGNPKVTNIPGGANYVTSALNVVTLAADVTNNNAVANTIQDVTGLSFPVVAGETYWFRFAIDYTSAATTTGSRWAVNGPTATRLVVRMQTSLAAAAGTDGITMAVSTAYNTPAASGATSANTAGNLAILEGFITPSANGTVIARFASEVAASAIVAKAGSMLQWMRTL
jgi:hypothetical protein